MTKDGVKVLVGLRLSSDLPLDFPGLDHVMTFLRTFDDMDENKPVPYSVKLEARQSDYRRTYKVTLSDWRPRPESGRAGRARLGLRVYQMDYPTQPLIDSDRRVTVDGLHLGLPAEDYLAIPTPPRGAIFRPDTDQLYSIIGNVLAVGDSNIASGDPVQAAVDLLGPLGYETEQTRVGPVLSNGRVSLLVRNENGRIASFQLAGNARPGGPICLDPHGPALTIHGFRPGATEVDLLRDFGPPDREFRSHDDRVLQWGPWTKDQAGMAGVKLEAVVDGQRAIRLRGDQIEQNGSVLLTYRTPLTAWWKPHDSAGETGIREDSTRYFEATLQRPDLIRTSLRGGPERVLDFTDHGLAIWEYPGHLRQFVLVDDQPPTLGINGTVP